MRWKFVIPVGIIIIVTVLAALLFLDPLLRRALISSGESVFGAKVEVASLKTRFKDLSVSITGLAVADRNNEWKNIFSVEQARFGMKLVPLLSKKFIIDDLSITGISWGTQRTTSGALPPKKRAALAEKAARDNKDSAVWKMMNAVQDRAVKEAAGLPPVQTILAAQDLMKDFSADKLIDAAGLTSIREMETLQKGVQDKYAQYQVSLGAINVDAQLAELRAAVEAVGQIKINTVADIEPAQARLARLRQAKAAVEGSIKTLAELQSRASSDFGAQKDMLQRINEMKDRDLKALSEKFQLPSFSMNNLSQVLFGPAWLNRVQSAMYYVHLAQKYMPPRKKEEAVVERQRLRGTDVSFPLAYNPPDFLIGAMKLSGSTGGPGKPGAPLDFAGSVRDITSDPVLLGRPVVAQLAGAQAGRSLKIDAVFNHCQPVAEDVITAAYTGMPASALGIPSSEYLPSFDTGTAAVTARFAFTGGVLDSTLDLAISGFSLSVSTSPRDAAREIIEGLWDGVKTITVTAKVTGTADTLSMSVSSNLDAVFAQRLKKMFGAKLAEAQARLRAEIDKLTEQKKQELLAQFNEKRDALLSQVTGRQKELQSQVDAATSQANARENDIKSKADAEKNKAADELKKKAGDAVKDVLKF